MIENFEFISFIIFIIGALLFTGKKASNPKWRGIGLFVYCLGGIVYIVFCIFVGLYWFLSTQIVFEILDARGIINCYYEIKKKECSKNLI